MTSAHLTFNYGERNICFTKAAGVWLTDSQQHQWLDALCGIGVTSLGHCHPSVNNAIKAQIDALDHVSNLYHTPIQQLAAHKLCEVSQMSKVYFCNSGAEANEAAIKLARLHGRAKRGHSGTLICFDGAFHGRTIGALSATAKEAIKAPFAPLLADVKHLPFNDIEALEHAFSNDLEADAILLELIQGESGVHLASERFIETVKQLCLKHDLLLMIDEVQTGNSRTGQWFAYQHFSLKPDVVSTAKGLGNGFPVGATLVSEKARDLLYPGSHGSTYGGNPAACAAICAVIEIVKKDQVHRNVEKQSKRLREALAQHPNVDYVEGLGMMLGVQLIKSINDLPQRFDQSKLLVNCISDTRIRLLPPLVISDTELDELIARLYSALDD
ncbi:MAG: acetylornithine/succinylornithine family transaminase [Gammaproteobacteria bacterium]|nr:acetylornithine/succinylornithine family transaminase [Gammaproteobacteria bacterium]